MRHLLPDWSCRLLPAAAAGALHRLLHRTPAQRGRPQAVVLRRAGRPAWGHRVCIRQGEHGTWCIHRCQIALYRVDVASLHDHCMVAQDAGPSKQQLDTWCCLKATTQGSRTVVCSVCGMQVTGRHALFTLQHLQHTLLSDMQALFVTPRQPAAATADGRTAEALAATAPAPA